MASNALVSSVKFSAARIPPGHAPDTGPAECRGGLWIGQKLRHSGQTCSIRPDTPPQGCLFAKRNGSAAERDHISLVIEIAGTLLLYIGSGVLPQQTVQFLQVFVGPTPLRHIQQLQIVGVGSGEDQVIPPQTARSEDHGRRWTRWLLCPQTARRGLGESPPRPGRRRFQLIGHRQSGLEFLAGGTICLMLRHDLGQKRGEIRLPPYLQKLRGSKV